MTYRIKDWGDTYENSRSKSIKDCQWTPIPNKQSGLGYKKLIMGHKNGTAHYGAWVAIVLRCSKQTDRSGYLTDGGRKTDPPLTIDDIALMTSVPAKIFEEALPRFVEIGWLEEIPDVMAMALPQDTTALPQSEFSLPPNRRKEGIELNGMEGKESSELPSEYADLSDAFYKQRASKFSAIHPKGFTEKEIQAGAETIDKLIRLDGYTFEQVTDVLKYALEDDFWSRNVQSIPQIRKSKFKTMLGQMAKNGSFSDLKFDEKGDLIL